jgi:hypothetical protein
VLSLIKEMKRYIFTFFIFCLAVQLFAQINIGITAGPVFSNRTIRDVPDLIAPLLPPESKTFSSFYFGGYADFPISNLIDLSPELYYAGRGRKLVDNTIPLTITAINNNIASPLLIKFNFFKKRLKLYTGPEFSYVVSRDSKGVTTSKQSKSKDEKSFDVAITAGTSFEIIKNLSIDLRYIMGLIDQSKTYYIPGDFIGPEYAGQQIPVDYKAFNWAVQAGLKYSFNLK